MVPAPPLVLLSIGDGSAPEPGTALFQWADRTVAGGDLCSALIGIFAPDRVVRLGVERPLPSPGDTAERWQPIPPGGDEASFRTIFSLICAAVDGGDRVIVEIGACSPPLSVIAFVAVQYLREAKEVRIERICAGVPGPDGVVMVRDLAGLLTILDWMRGVHGFTRHVDASDLAALMGSVQDQVYRDGSGHPISLKPWGHALSLFTRAVRLSRPREVMQAADVLTAHFAEVTAEVEHLVLPLAPVMDRLQEVTAMGRGGSPDRLSWEALAIGLNLIEYQCRHDLFMQAVTLAREWCLNYLILELDHHPDRWLAWEVREEIGRTITGAALAARHHPYEGTTLSARFARLDQRDELVALWLILSDLRNDIAHCGMNQQQMSAATIQDRTGEMVKRLRLLVAGSSCRVTGEGSGDDRSPELPPGEGEHGDGEGDEPEE